MKKVHFYIPVLFAALLGISSCSKDLLEQTSPDQLTTDNFWKSKDKAVGGLAAAYSQLEGFVGWDNYIEARSVREFYREDMVVPGRDAYNYAWWMEHFNFSFTSGNYAIDLLWRENYRGINFSNQVLENVSAMTVEMIDDASKKQILAEARFLRAYYHFKLLTNFNKIILRDKVPVSPSDLNKSTAERKDAWEFIIADLLAAEKDLALRSKQPSEEMGRTTKGAAQAYLGKVFLYRAGEDKAGSVPYYTEASRWLLEVIKSKEYKLQADFLSMFNGTLRNTPESVFELQQNADSENGAYYRSQMNTWLAAEELGGYGELYGTPQLVTEMTKEGRIAKDGLYDHRIYGTIFFKDPYFNDAANPRVYDKTYDAYFGNNQVAFRKWLPLAKNRITRSNPVNVPLMRYADVLLLYAEAENELGHGPVAMEQINAVRDRAGMPALTLTDKQAIFKQLVHERVMELTIEGSRFYDLRRWGMLEASMTAAGRKFSADKAFYPLPLKETINNPLTQ
ncbi:RagB/SusD family nutrient uptake outer membrane protein [Chitinophaga defluvii]|uniref:RagB/SusD family nutrient uptake outer membrane protein n=1 Tax=Chitinophaga defluvii TaxID=3163343 RepID=A0ABV2T0J8_9BACT